MRLFLFILTFLSNVVAAGDLPWIGVKLEEASREEREAAGFAREVGLKVVEVAPLGPFELAMGKEGDLWFKFDGQILMNRGQMVGLLRTKKAGDEIPVELFRNGKLQTIQLVLGDRPKDKMHSNSFRGPHGGGCRTLLTERVELAKLSSDGIDFSLQKDGESLKYEVRENGRILLSETMKEAEINLKVPTKWLDSYMILKLTLDQHASTVTPSEERRVRYLPRNQGSKE